MRFVVAESRRSEDKPPLLPIGDDVTFLHHLARLQDFQSDTLVEVLDYGCLGAGRRGRRGRRGKGAEMQPGNNANKSVCTNLSYDTTRFPCCYGNRYHIPIIFVS